MFEHINNIAYEKSASMVIPSLLWTGGCDTGIKYEVVFGHNWILSSVETWHRGPVTGHSYESQGEKQRWN